MFKEKIVSMCSHNGALFVATTEAVYALDGSGTWRVITEIAEGNGIYRATGTEIAEVE